MNKISNKGGFIEILTLIIVVLVIAAILGFDVGELWNNYIIPLIKIIVEFFVVVFELLIEIARSLIGVAGGLVQQLPIQNN